MNKAKKKKGKDGPETHKKPTEDNDIKIVLMQLPKSIEAWNQTIDKINGWTRVIEGKKESMERKMDSME